MKQKLKSRLQRRMQSRLAVLAPARLIAGELHRLFFVPKIIPKGSDLLELFESVTGVWFFWYTVCFETHASHGRNVWCKYWQLIAFIAWGNRVQVRCHGQALLYLAELCQPVAGVVTVVASRQHLRSAIQQLLVVPRYQLSFCGRRAFCVAGPSVWNSLPDSLRNLIIGGNNFRQSLETFLFATYWCIQRIRGFMTMRSINRLFSLLTYLLTYCWPAVRARYALVADVCRYISPLSVALSYVNKRL